jgi:Domain of unknown function (DUF4878)
MKKIVSVLFIAASVAILAVGCKGKDSVANDPKAVLIAFFERMAKKDMDGAAMLATKESKATMDMMKKAMTMAESMKDKMGGLKDSMDKKDPAEEFKKMKIGEAKIDGDKATVSVTNPSKDDKTFDFPLKKEGGEWKVDFSMGTLMQMGMNQGGKSGAFDNMDKNDMSDTAGYSDKLDKLMNADSLKDAMKDAMGKLDSVMKNVDPEQMKKVQEAMKELNKMKQ